MKNQTDWVRLVEDAGKSNDGLEKLYEELKPMFEFLKFLCNGSYVEDAIQEARLRIWRVLDRVDLKRPTEIRAFLSTSALWAVRSCLKNYHKQHFYNGIGTTVYENIVEEQSPSLLFDYDETLQAYLNYVEENGQFLGAHAYMAKKSKLSKSRISQIFKEVSTKFIGKYHLAGSLS